MRSPNEGRGPRVASSHSDWVGSFPSARAFRTHSQCAWRRFERSSSGAISTWSIIDGRCLRQNGHR
jgi:hypothetical protein